MFNLDDERKEALANKAGLSFFYARAADRARWVQSFHTYFKQVLSIHTKPGREVYTAAGISERMFRRFEYDLIPSKNSLTAIGITLGLGENGIQNLLRRAGYILSASIASDAIVLWFIRQENQTASPKNLLYEINETLNALGFPLLSTREKKGNKGQN